MHLNPGDQAPDWTLMAVAEDFVTEISLSQLLGGHNAIILSTYPLDFSGPCGSQLCRFKDAYSDLKRDNIELVSMSVDSPFAHLAWARELDIPFPVASDFNRTVLPLYGALERGTTFLRDIARRTAFVIDSSRTVRYSWYADEDGELPAVDDVVRQAHLVGTRGEIDIPELMA